MLEDLKRGKLTMTDESAFEVGVNVAATPGKVVWEGRLFQLIQYAPTTEKVFEIPLLIMPPWINKFYILDLTPEKSFIRWAVDQGFTVFVISWAQGSEALSDIGIEDYAVEGELAAIDLVLAATGAPATHVIGYCVAGTVLSATLAYMAATGQAEKVRSATFFTAQVDFTEAGELLNFVNEPMLETIDKLTEKDGYLDGRWLATTFNMLRPTDLMWNYVVNNYLKGKDYVPFDLLYWNSDPTNVPGRFMREYVGGLYRDNRLVQPGGITVKGVPIDLKAVKTPAYIQAGKDDHIAPRQSCFKLTTAFSGEHRFMLAGSGHIAGVVNPPSSGKYQHWTLPKGMKTPATLEEFQAAAGETRGSWWPDWLAWLEPRSGAKVKARVPGKAKGFKGIEDAPGRYVKQRIA
jgi:polyhydroxyalkanoate synthase